MSHMATQFDDPGLAAALHLTVPAGVSPSTAIRDWLTKDCPDPSTYTYKP
jgi:hypothetical protein